MTMVVSDTFRQQERVRASVCASRSAADAYKTDRTLWTTMLLGMIAFLVNQVEEDASLSNLTLPPPSPLATRGLVVFWAGIASHVHRRVGWCQG